MKVCQILKMELGPAISVTFTICMPIPSVWKMLILIALTSIFIRSFILSFYSQPYDRFVASSKVNSPQVAIHCFFFQFTVFCLFFNVTQQILTSSSSFPLHFYPSLYLSFNNVFQKAVPTQKCPIQLAFLLFIVCRIFLCSLTLCNNSSFLTPSIQLIFSILLQHQISKLSRRF